MARLIDAAEGRRGRFVVLADRVARRYAPAVHLCALLTFLFWVFVMHVAPGQALLIACAVLIITCPCALALAVPAAQVIATGALFRDGTLLKSGTALERLAAVDTVVFDKTGTLSEPDLALIGEPDQDVLALAASLATASRHPLARALVIRAPVVAPARGVVEHPGLGLTWDGPEGEIRLGSGVFCGAEQARDDAAELWLRRPGLAPVRFAFAEALRPDAAATVARLVSMGLQIHLLSGDREAPVRRMAAALGITQFQARCSPAAKMALVEQLGLAGRHVLMVGDGLNDGPSLAAASVSMSPASAAEISQNVADLVFQGHHLAPVAIAVETARRTQRVMRQNIAMAILYNVLVVPVAACGYVTPWLAAAAMSLSSLLVMGNSLRLRGRRAS
jgi:Cu2+-exporting ATPase